MYELWVWVVKDEDGREGAIAAQIPEVPSVGTALLQHRDRMIAERLEPLARRHGETVGQPVRLVHLVEADGSKPAYRGAQGEHRT